MVVHFPVALIFTGFLADVVYRFFVKEPFLTEARFWLFFMGSLSAFAAYFSGAFLTGNINGAASAVVGKHELFAEITVFLALVSTGLMLYLKLEKKEKGYLNRVSFVLNLFTTISLIVTGHLGGVLVYDYLIG
jgi:uncharacterized membrane protein